MKASFPVLLVALFTGCGIHVKEYAAPEVTAWNVPSRSLLYAAREVVVDRGWEVVEISTDRLEAVSTGVEMSGAFARERWTFAVVEEGMTVSRRMEVQWEAGASWEWAADVCGNYQYLSEREVVQSIHMRLSGQEGHPTLLDDVWVVTASR